MENTQRFDGKRRTENLPMQTQVSVRKFPLLWLLLAGLALLAIACEPRYSKVSEDELVAMELRAVVESVTVDFKNPREKGIYIKNGHQRVGFQAFAVWYSPTTEPGFQVAPWDSGYICEQHQPVIHDSLFKPKNSRRMYVRLSRNKELDSIVIVSRRQFERALKFKFEISEKYRGKSDQ